MSALVAQHQQASFATPINGGAGDATVVLGNDNATVTTYNAHDADPTIHVQSSSAATFAATPAATAGRKWMTNDTGAVYLYYDTGSAWVEANYLRNTGGTVTGNVIITGNLTVTGVSSFSNGSTAPVKISNVSNVTTQGAISFNNLFAYTNIMGITGSALTALTLNDPVEVRTAIAGSVVFLVNATTTAVTGILTATGNFAIATSKFTVAAATGNTVVAGTLSATGRVIGAAGYTTDAAKTAALLHIYGNVVSTTVLGRFESSDRRVDIYSDEIRSAGSYLTLNGDGVTGVAVGSPTGGNKGGGTCNFAGDIYKNNSAYTNPHYAFEHWATGKIVKYADREGASTYKGRMSLTDLEAYVREHHHFPRITDEPAGGFHRSDILLELVEEAFTHLIDLRKEIDTLKALS